MLHRRRTLPGKITDVTLRDAILETAREYLTQGRTPAQGLSPEEINDGNCEEFAVEVIRKMGGENPDLHEIWVENFLVDGGDYRINGKEPAFDWPLLEAHWKTPKPENHEVFDRVGGCNHCFILHQGRFYDSETPDGVDSFFELPFYQRQIKRELDNEKKRKRIRLACPAPETS